MINKEKILASACLAGKKCRYDGNTNCRLFREDDCCVTVFCPETEGGLPIPRDPAEIVGGDGYDVLAGFAKVVTKNGKEVTREFVRGAEKALELCLEKGITRAVLKSKSPSCGQTHIYDGTFSKVLRKGCGVTAALLTYYGIKVEEEVCFEREPI